MAVLPLPSVTVQITVVFPRANAEGALLVTLATEQLSAVTGVPRATPVAVQAVLVKAETLAGAVIVGFWLSEIVTVKLPVALPQVLLAVTSTVFVPFGKEKGLVIVVPFKL